MRSSFLRPLAVAVTLTLAAAACGTSPDDPGSATEETAPATEGSATDPVTVRLLTHESFVLTESLLDDFAAETGITIQVLANGDAGSLLNQAILTADAPQGDVLFGVDNNLLARALEAGVFQSHTSPLLTDVDPDLVPDTDVVTPIDRGDVCINIDLAYFADADVPAPTRLDDLVDPAYAGLLVVEDPSTSSPGLAFLLATIDRYGDDWPTFWEGLVANDVQVEAGWSEAYYGAFSGGAGEGDRPLVVSYASSPAAEVLFADPPTDVAPTAALLDSCYRQVEYAGILAGTEVPEAAAAVVDWLLSDAVQADIPLNMFVHPARTSVPLPQVFLDHAAVADDPAEIDPATIREQETAWLARWAEVVLS